MKYCCDRFQFCVEIGDIYEGVLYPDIPKFMTDWDRLTGNKLLAPNCCSAGNDGVAWDSCPFCGNKLTLKKIKVAKKYSRA